MRSCAVNTDIVDSISEPVALIYFICARNEDIIVIALIGCEAYLAVFNSLSLDRAVLYKKNFALVCDRERIFGIDLESKVLCFRLRVEKLSALYFFAVGIKLYFNVAIVILNCESLFNRSV